MTLSTTLTVKVNGTAIKGVSKVTILPDCVEIETYKLDINGMFYVENDAAATETKAYPANTVEIENI